MDTTEENSKENREGGVEERGEAFQNIFSGNYFAPHKISKVSQHSNNPSTLLSEIKAKICSIYMKYRMGLNKGNDMKNKVYYLI